MVENDPENKTWKRIYLATRSRSERRDPDRFKIFFLLPLPFSLLSILLSFVQKEEKELIG